MSIVRTAAAALLMLSSVAPAQKAELLERYHPQSWTLMPEVRLKAWNNLGVVPAQPRDASQLPRSDRWEFQAASVIWPVVERSSSSTANLSSITGKLRFMGQEESDDVEILSNKFHSGIRFAKMTLDPLPEGQTYTGNSMVLNLEIPSTCYRTKFDEDLGRQFEWPDGDWPEVAMSTFEPMNFIDYGPDGPYDMAYIDRIVKNWTNGAPKSVPPMVLAKWFAGELAQKFQISGNGLNASPAGMLEGIDIRPGGAPEAAKQMRGNEFEMALVLTALYRRAGLPARLVVGYDVGAAKGEGKNNTFLDKKRSDLALRAYVEFALYDEKGKDLYWIPVDVAQIRSKRGSRLPPDWLTDPLKYFGTHDELDYVVPIAFQLHPPTAVRAYGSPGFWGWGVYGQYPPPGRAWQEIRIQAITTPTRAGDAQQQRQRGNTRRR